MKTLSRTKATFIAGVVILANFAIVGTASAHCDGLDGPVITEAKAALEKKDVTPLLKWVPEEGEQAVKDAFDRTLTARADGRSAQEAADHQLFETLVRVHRESEGAPFTGIKPAGQIAPAVMEADEALVRNNVDRLAEHLAAQVERSVLEKFEKAARSREAADQSVEKGREFVSNYVQYVHFVEGLSNMATQPSEHHGADTNAASRGH